MVTILQALVILHIAFGACSLVFFAFRSEEALMGLNLPWLGLLILGLANPILLISVLGTMHADSSSPDLVTTKLVTISACSFVLALAAAAMVKHLTASVEKLIKNKTARVIAKYLIFVLWAGAASAIVSGVVRAGAYNANYADYTLSPRLQGIADGAAKARIADEMKDWQTCAFAMEATRKFPIALLLRRTTGSWLDSAKFYAVAPATGPAAQQLTIKYRYASAVADHTPIEAAQYILTRADGSECVVDARPQPGDRTAPIEEMREPLRLALANYPALIAREKARPIGWTVLAGAGALQEVGFDDYKVIPKGAPAEKLDRMLKWFNKLLLGSLLLWMIGTPTRKQPDQETPKDD